MVQFSEIKGHLALGPDALNSTPRSCFGTSPLLQKPFILKVLEKQKGFFAGNPVLFLKVLGVEGGVPASCCAPLCWLVLAAGFKSGRTVGTLQRRDVSWLRAATSVPLGFVFCCFSRSWGHVQSGVWRSKSEKGRGFLLTYWSFDF